MLELWLKNVICKEIERIENHHSEPQCALSEIIVDDIMLGVM